MAQHDYNIANQLFPAARGDINAMATAIVTNNSGTTAPTTTFASMWWHDTVNNIIKVRNLTNDGWVSVFNVATASSFAPGATGATGATGPQGPVGPAPDTSAFIHKAGDVMAGSLSGPAGTFTNFSATNALITNLNVGDSSTLSGWGANFRAQYFRFYGPGVGGDVGWDWAAGLGVAYVFGDMKGYFDGSGNAVFPNFIVFSDRKLKKKIKKLGSVSDLIDTIDPVSFEMKKGNGKRRLGFIAQDFAGTPAQHDVHGGLALDNMALTAILWQTVKELRAEVTAWPHSAK